MVQQPPLVNKILVRKIRASKILGLPIAVKKLHQRRRKLARRPLKNLLKRRQRRKQRKLPPLMRGIQPLLRLKRLRRLKRQSQRLKHQRKAQKLQRQKPPQQQIVAPILIKIVVLSVRPQARLKSKSSILMKVMFQRPKRAAGGHAKAIFTIIKTKKARSFLAFFFIYFQTYFWADQNL